MNNLLLNLYVKFQNLISNEEGQDLVEYALLVTLIALAAITGVARLPPPSTPCSPMSALRSLKSLAAHVGKKDTPPEPQLLRGRDIAARPTPQRSLPGEGQRCVRD